MLPTFEVIGDYFVIARQYRRGRGVEVGDIITFDSVVHPAEKVIKRVLGLPGDYVMLDTPGVGSERMVQVCCLVTCMGRRRVNDGQVPEGHCWVVGDNLPYSRDSRLFGPLPMALIRGKVIAKIFPWRERRWIVNDLKLV